VPQTLKTIGLLLATPALNSLLAAVLAASPRLRVRPFESEIALTTYLRLAPADLLVLDLDHPDAPADRLASALRENAELVRRPAVMAVAGVMDLGVKMRCLSAGIDEVLLKPMSPLYLRDRVEARLLRRPGPREAAAAPKPLDWTAYGNVVPFPRRPAPTLPA
jgi:two-component system, OmpR family, phosphate regulon response regulator PhoB